MIGKILGTSFGFLVGRLIGAIFGFMVGHAFDKGFAEALKHKPLYTSSDLAREAFFNSTFRIMGHIAKCDGHVSEQEIRQARIVMAKMHLSEADKISAMQLFNEGKSENFDLEQALSQLIRYCGRRYDLLQLFIEIEIDAAFADGTLHTAVEESLLIIARRLGISNSEFMYYINKMRAQHKFQQGKTNSNTQQSYSGSLTHAYQLLGVETSSSDADIKKAYRKLMSQYHPDKLVAKGLPKEMMEFAKEKTQSIRTAYDTIMSTRENTS